jgi:hypothetical protein
MAERRKYTFWVAVAAEKKIVDPEQRPRESLDRSRGSSRRVQSQLQMRVCVRMPVIQLQRVAQIRFASIDTSVRGSNPKRPMHEDVHSNT